MMGLATIFFVQDESGSIAVAGFAVAAFSVTAAALAPARGRLVDRRGFSAGLLPLVLAHAAATGAFLVVAPLPGHDALFVVVAALGGATAPPVNASMRALWPSLVERDQLDAAYGTEAVLQEASYLVGPLLTGLAVTALSPSAPIVGATGLTLLGGILFAGEGAAAGWGRSDKRERKRLLVNRGVRALIASLALASLAGGVLEVAIPSFAEQHSSPLGAGGLIAAMSAASLVGGVWYGMRRWRIAPLWRFVGASALGAVGYGLTIPASSAPAFVIALVVFGFSLAPGLAAVYSILDDVAPPGSAVESVTWLTTSTAGGAAVGAAIGGVVIDQASVPAALGLGAMALVLATAVPLVWRDSLAARRPASRLDSRAEPASDSPVTPPLR
jgi:MFS family permease